MQRVIELARVVRERHNRPVKTPLRELVVVHPDESFLSDIAGALALRCSFNPSCPGSCRHDRRPMWGCLPVGNSGI